jgi:hypothetical protein
MEEATSCPTCRGRGDVDGKDPQDLAYRLPCPDCQGNRTQANSYQVGGDHYRKRGGEQHWDRVWRVLGPKVAWAYFVGKITGYVERYRDKNGLQDLRKASHFLQKLIELESTQLGFQEGSVWNQPTAREAPGQNGETLYERIWRMQGPEVAWVFFAAQVVELVEQYQIRAGVTDLHQAQYILTSLIRLEERTGLVKDGPPVATPMQEPAQELETER